ncbi:MAG: lipopolysaccharide biosynthesis protein [Desulfobaccales bacterium]
MRKRLIQGIGANFLAQSITLASRVLLVPLFLTAWGVRVYGEWLLLSSVVAYLSLTDLGGQLYIVNRLTQAYALGDVPQFRKILHTGLALFLILPLAVFLGFLGLMLVFPPGSLLQITITSRPVVFLVMAILAFQFVFSLPQGILLGVYRSVGLLPRGVMLTNLMQLLVLILVALGLWLHRGLEAIACLQLLPYLGVALVAGWDLNRRFPQFHLFSLREADLSLGLSFIRPSLDFFGIQMSQAFTIQGTILVVGMLLGPVQVVVFATMRTIVNLIRSFFEQVSHAAWPELTRLDAQLDEDKFFLLFRAIFRTTLIAAVIFIALFHFWGENIYHVWLRKTVAYQQRVMDLFLIYMGEFLIWLTCCHPLMATNRHRTLAKMLLVSSALNLGLAYLGGRHLGLPGVILGMIIGDLLLPCWFVPHLLNRYQPRFSGWFFIKELAPLILSLPVFLTLPWSAPLVIIGLFWWWTRCLAGLGLPWEGRMPFLGGRG